LDLFKDKDKRRGAIGTITVHLILLIVFALYGLTYMEPRPEQGILINFGTSNVGSGDVQPDTPGETDSPESTQTEVTETSEPVPTSAEQEVLTQDNIETVSVPEKPEKTAEEIEAERKAEEERKKQEEYQNKLKNIWDKTQSGGGSEGDDNESGDKGQIDGQKSPGAYSGTPGGGGGGGDYQLAGRNALKKAKPNYDCQESGTVVVRVRVNRLGVTTSAEVVIKGTTNMASCLTTRAKQAALKTKWEPKPDAPEVQIGRITYRFELN
jgi:outer membrane biosynthesis protein TonB